MSSQRQDILAEGVLLSSCKGKYQDNALNYVIATSASFPVCYLSFMPHNLNNWKCHYTVQQGNLIVLPRIMFLNQIINKGE